MGGGRSHLIPFHRRRSGFVLRLDCTRWGGTAEDLRHVALSAPHARTRERALALYEITQGSCATRVAARTGRHPRPLWVGCTPITPRGLVRSRSAAPAAAPPLREDRGSASRRRLRRPAYGRHPTPRRSRP